MEKQRYVVTLEVSPGLDRFSPEVEAQRMANIIRDAVQTRSWSFKGLVPFKVTVANGDEVASASGKVGKHALGDLDEVSGE